MSFAAPTTFEEPADFEQHADGSRTWHRHTSGPVAPCGQQYEGHTPIPVSAVPQSDVLCSRPGCFPSGR